jgi:hypothetical protein
MMIFGLPQWAFSAGAMAMSVKGLTTPDLATCESNGVWFFFDTSYAGSNSSPLRENCVASWNLELIAAVAGLLSL